MQSIVYRFITKRTIRGALILGLIFGLITVTTAIGYNNIYATLEARLRLAAAFGANTGIMALVGTPHHIETIHGFTEWRVIGLFSPIGAIWGLLTATRLFRGEEESGRWELFLAGQTTARRATAQGLLAVMSSLLGFYVLLTLCIVLIGRNVAIAFSVRESLLFTLTLTLILALFFAIGAFTSQLAATRRKAAGYAATIFGVFFAMRAIGSSVADYRWLLDITPLGWVQQVHPFTGSQPQWFIPLVISIVLVSLAAIYLAGRRDIGESIITDRNTAKPRLHLLQNAWTASVRLSRASIFGWLAGFVFSGALFGGFATLASTALDNNASTLQRVAGETGGNADTTIMYISLGFFINAVLMMVMVTGLVGALREDEAKGYLDNFLVRPFARLSLFTQRIALIVMVILLLGLANAMTCGILSALQDINISIADLLLAGINMTIPALFLLGLGIFTIGLAPRLTTVVMYIVLGWSFIMEMLGSILQLNNFLLNTSLLHHLSLAPAIAPQWSTNLVITGLGAVLTAIGMLLITKRDIQTE